MPRESGAWARDKLKILELYLKGYLGATTSALERIYIDGFAGPGTNRVGSSGDQFDGSPLIALNAAAQNGTRFDRLYFIERRGDVLKELRSTVEARSLLDRATFILGDVNSELPRLVQTLPLKSPTFVFLDPEGIDPSWQTVQAISPWRTELLINFPFGMAMNRNRRSPKVTEYFGTEGWRQIWRPGRAPVRELLDFYKARLRRLGYEYSPEHDRLIRTDGNARLYYLMLVSKVSTAAKIMKWVFEQPDASGQTRMRLT